MLPPRQYCSSCVQNPRVMTATHPTGRSTSYSYPGRPPSLRAIHPSIHPTDEPPTEAADHHRFSTSASSQPSMKPSDNTTLIMLNHRRKSPPWKEQWNDLYSVYMYLYHTLFIFLYLCRSASPQEKTNRMDSELNSIL